ncbi:MAG: RNA helicase, partial [Steroidobacteraceae bacterium]
GRTARAGAEGDAISFGCEEYAIALPEIEDYIGHKIPAAPVARELLAADAIFPPRISRYDRPDGPRGRPGGGGNGRPPNRGRPPQRRSGGGRR